MVPVAGKRRSASPAISYHVAEGNRRICALKLLNDPDLAPPAIRKDFEKLSYGWNIIKAVPAVVFKSSDDVRIWLDRVHSGPQGGIGRKPWNSDQKQRFWGGNKNRLALMLLDYAEEQKMIDAEEREGKLTTAQRFLSNPILRETIGIDVTNDEELNRTRPKPEFDILVKTFVDDLVAGKSVTSRMNKDAIQNYARNLVNVDGVTNTRIASEPIAGQNSVIKPRQIKKPKKPKHAVTVQYEREISTALKEYDNQKLESLYYSITAIELEHHTPLVCVGTWAFFESLTACAGRNDGTPFKDFLTKARLNTLGVAGDTRAARAAIERIADYGNVTKHHAVAVTFNGDQLNNDMVLLKNVILGCVTAATTKAV